MVSLEARSFHNVSHHGHQSSVPTRDDKQSFDLPWRCRADGMANGDTATPSPRYHISDVLPTPAINLI